MGMGGGKDEDYNSEINVTPMVDIMLVLLIIFMVVTPLLQQGVVVKLPGEMNSPTEDTDITKDTSVLISIPNNGEYYVGKDRLAKEVMGEKIQKMMEDKPPEKRIVYIKSGADVDYGTVVEAVNIVRQQNVDRIGLVADKKKGAAKQAE